MLKLSIKDIVNKIKKEEKFSCIALDSSFYIAIEDYVPFVCAAIHNGNNLRRELKRKIALSDFERWYEEDPLTGEFISSMPIRIIANDSRYEYDLNRSPEKCIYEEAWGKKVWKFPLSQEERRKSLKKYYQFYRVIDVLMEKLLEKFGKCIVYDIHSYNYKRIKGDTPLFNIGVEKIDTKKFGKIIENWYSQLSKIKISGIENRVAINEVFKGRGYFLEYITMKYDVLVLATEIKKIYCDENTGEIYQNIVKELKEGLEKSIIKNVEFFLKNIK